MPVEALEIAWGYPLKRRITFEQGLKREEWTYTDGKRIAYLEEGRVVSVRDSTASH
jgi:hypothetical protein